MVLLSTNRMDILLTPSGDEILRSYITVQTHIYTIPDFPTVTNSVPVWTNSTHLQMKWVEVAAPTPVQLPPVPSYITTNSASPPSPRTQIKP